MENKVFTYTVLLLTYNEENRIEFVLRNFKNHANIVVLDNGSTDKTIDIALQYNAKVIQRPKSFGFINKDAAKWVLDQSETEYVFIAFCSIQVPDAILKVFNEVSTKQNYKAVKHGYISVTYNKYIDRPYIFRKSSACHFFSKTAIDLNRSGIHQEWPLKDDIQISILQLPANDEHSLSVFRDYDVQKTELKHSVYADIEALQRFERGETTTPFKMIYKSIYEFFYGYVRSGGILAGMPGFLYHVWRAQMVFNIQARLWEFQSGMTIKESRIRQEEMRNKILLAVDNIELKRHKEGDSNAK